MEILFVCTGNTCRSPMAEGILNRLNLEEGLNLKAQSAGIFASNNGSISTRAVEALKEIQIDIDKYTSKSIDSINIKSMDLILAMGNSHKNFLLERYPEIEDRIFLLNEYAFARDEDIEDPFGGDLEKYKIVRDQIYKAILEIIRREKDENRNRQ